MILQVQFFLTVCTDNLNKKDDDFGHRLFCVLLVIYAGSLSNVGVFTLRVFFGTNHSYGWCHSFCSKVEYVL